MSVSAASGAGGSGAAGSMAAGSGSRGSASTGAKAHRAPKPSEPAPAKGPTAIAPGTGGAPLSGEEARRLALGGDLDYAALGFRCGLEVHQQLDTRKLFSPCASDVVEPDAVAARAFARYDRRLRVTQGETGELDVAALAEARRQRAFTYLAIGGTTSLVELDEEPPHPMSQEALDVALTFCGLTGARPVAEVHPMRKIVIDGSNTSGFQRTALVATGGTVDAEGGAVGVWTIALEEDSARKLDEHGSQVVYALDRLGIPLIEIATAPDVKDPKHAQATAARLGALLRATGKVKRGLGTIRQDLNVSVAVGDRVEIKGCQDLRAVPRVIEREVRRQLWMHHVAQALRERGFDAGSLGVPKDVTDHFSGTQAKLVAASLQKGGRVLCMVLPKWAGLVGGEANGPRMGREFADHARVAAGVKGIFHSDELPTAGIRADEVSAVRKGLGLAPEDAFVLCVEDERVAQRALAAVSARAAAALGPAQREVRAAQPDESTRFMRPLPGAARMYPETDVPPTRIEAAHWKEVRQRLPPKPEERLAAVVRRHAVSEEVAKQVLAQGVEQDFEQWIEGGAEPGLAARLLLQLLPALKDPERGRRHAPALLAKVAAGNVAKEALPSLLKALDDDASLDAAGALAKAGVAAADASEVDAVCRRVVQERFAFVRERGEAALGPLMGPVMAQLRGKADGQLVNARLRAAIQDAVRQGGVGKERA